jgi:hypothetical protein
MMIAMRLRHRFSPDVGKGCLGHIAHFVTAA